MAGLCPWDSRGKANSWRPPPPPVPKNLQKKCKALQYCDSNDFIELRCSVRVNVTSVYPPLTCGRSVTAFSAPPRSRRPGQGPRSPHPKAGPVHYIVFWTHLPSEVNED